MSHQYCGLCHLSVKIPSSHQDQFNEINKEILYLHSLSHSLYKLQIFMSGESIIPLYNALIDKNPEKSFLNLKTNSLIMNKDQEFRHQLPTMIKMSQCLHDIEIESINQLYCPTHFASFLNHMERFKKHTVELQKELEDLKKIVIQLGNFCDEFVLSLFQMVKMTQSLAQHIVDKRTFLEGKIEKLILKQTLDGLRGDYLMGEINISKMFAKNMNNRDDNKINYFKAFKEISPAVISPKEFLSKSTKGTKKQISEILNQKDTSEEFYSKNDLLKIESAAADNGYIFSCRQGYFWVKKEKNAIKDISNNFFISIHDCEKDCRNNSDI